MIKMIYTSELIFFKTELLSDKGVISFNPLSARKTVDNFYAQCHLDLQKCFSCGSFILQISQYKYPMTVNDRILSISPYFICQVLTKDSQHFISHVYATLDTKKINRLKAIK